MKDDIRNELKAELDKMRKELHTRDVNYTRLQSDLERYKDEEKKLSKDNLTLRMSLKEKNNQLEDVKGHQLFLQKLLEDRKCNKDKDNASTQCEAQTQMTLADIVCMGIPLSETQTANMVNVGTARNYGRIKRRKHLSNQTEYMEKNKGRHLQSTGSREEVALILSSIPCSSTEELTVVEDN
ncbi:hypothetical protein ACJMK2_026987 [Sinanodonta woodiana]|uniref:Uncharacterized protein n=1 Tax=Sinanodonta woodiana TaxID=1069815 RepID=A0ABD3XLF5_SINWO